MRGCILERRSTFNFASSLRGLYSPVCTSLNTYSADRILSEVATPVLLAMASTFSESELKALTVVKLKVSPSLPRSALPGFRER